MTKRNNDPLNSRKGSAAFWDHVGLSDSDKPGSEPKKKPRKNHDRQMKTVDELMASPERRRALNELWRVLGFGNTYDLSLLEDSDND